MRINRSLLNWGVFLIALGGVPLAVDQGWLESDIAAELGQLWPLILVGIGLGLILRWTPMAWFGGALVAATFGVIFGAAAVSLRDNDVGNVWAVIPAITSGACADGAAGDEATTREGIASGDAFELDVSLPCGELDVQRAEDTTWRVDATHDTGEAPRIDEIDGTTGVKALRIRNDSDDEIAFIGRQSHNDWNVQVPADASLTMLITLDAARGLVEAGPGPLDRLDGTLNAADATFDLGQAETAAGSRVGLTLNASDGSLVLPAGPVDGSVTLNASSLTVCAPNSVPMQVELTETLASSDLGDAGLEQVDDSTWTSPDFSGSGDHISLELTSTVSSLSIERPEACS
jgi:hypothetical protein